MLLAEVESCARARGAELLLTDTNVRGRAVAFYERHGFTPQSVILRKPLD